jgi:HEAT repeat protein
MDSNRRSTIVVIVFSTCLAIAQLGHCQIASTANERELVAVLESDAPAAEKALACKYLAVNGSNDAVPELARLLTDERLASWARIALEVIPGDAADEALLRASESVHGKLLVGIINSIGVRRDAGAVDRLSARLQNSDVDVASAAAIALGRIGNTAASQSLRRALAGSPATVRSAVAEGCVLCAERFLSDANPEEAAAIYDEVRTADVPQQRILEATRGAILARGDAGIPLLVEQFSSADNGMFQIALSVAREFPGDEVDKALSSQLDHIAPDRAAILIQAMADRVGTVDLPAILKAAQRGPNQVRIAAINSLGRIGDAACVSPLLEIALEPDAELAQTARGALAELAGDNVDKDIVARLNNAQGKMYTLLIELVGLRRINAIGELVKALDNSDKSSRTAALTSLGTTVSADELSLLISQVVSPKHADDAPVALSALKTASVRMPDRDACSMELATAIARSPMTTKLSLLEILGAVGGTKALQMVGIAAKSSDPQLQDVGTRLLGEWMTIDAAPVLLELSSSKIGDKYRVRALRGYIRIARQFVMPDNERATMCQNALDAAWQSSEQKLVLDVLKRYPCAETLKLAIKTRAIPEIKEEATEASMTIAQKLGSNPEELRELLSKDGLRKVKLEIIKAEYGAGATQDDVTALLQKHAASDQLILLPASDYNGIFGDPASGTPKQLRIQYRIDGKVGEATFAENALVFLPMPK